MAIRGGETDTRVDDHERAENLVREPCVVAGVRGGDLADDAAAVSQIEQLKVVGQRGDQHPEAVIARAKVTHGERHQKEAERDVDREQECTCSRCP